MEHQFANRELLDSGELLPVVALNDDGVQKTDTRDGDRRQKFGDQLYRRPVVARCHAS